MSSKTGCCPSTAWGKLETDSNYKAKGTVEKVEDIDIYKVGQVRQVSRLLWCGIRQR